MRNIAVSKGVRERVKVVEEGGGATDGLKFRRLYYRCGKPGHFARDASKCKQHPNHANENAAASNACALFVSGKQHRGHPSQSVIVQCSAEAPEKMVSGVVRKGASM